MLKNIYIHISHKAANFAVYRFCRFHKELLIKNNIYYLTLQDLFPQIPYFTQSLYGNNQLWINESDKKRHPEIVFPTEQEINTKLQEHIQNQQIENIVLIFHGNILSDYFSPLLLLKKTFPEAQFHILENSVVLERELECFYNLSNLFHMNYEPTACNMFYTLACINYNNYKYNYITDSCPLQKLLNYTLTQNTVTNEIDALQQFLSFIHIPTDTYSFYPNTFHPQVIAFFLAVREYFITDTLISFLDEYDVLNYKQKENYLFSYSTENNKKEITAYIQHPEPISTGITFKYIDCSNESIRIEFESACEVAKLLTPSMRQKLLNSIDNDYFPYYPYSSKIAYVAVMLAEHKIDEEKAKQLLQKTKGRIHTTTEKYSKNPLLTVFTATYNQKKYIKQCIESVLAQKTKYPFKHLIIDDASTDGTQEILKEYAQQYEHIELILHKKNTKTIALYHFPQNASTKYVSWCDGDDFYIDEHKLEEQIEILENNPDYGLCFHRTFILYEQERCIRKIHPQDSMLPNGIQKFYYPQDLIITNLLQSSSVMYRWLYQNSLTPHMPPFLLAPFDWALHILHAHKKKIGFIDKPMSVYRRHKDAMYYETELSVAKHLIRYCPNEIKFCTILDSETQYQYHTLFLKKMAMILDTFYNEIDTVEFDKNQYNIIKEQLEKGFPHVIKEVKDYLSSIK